MFKMYDSNAVDSSDDEVDYLSESSRGEDNWYLFGEITNSIEYHWTTNGTKLKGLGIR